MSILFFCGIEQITQPEFIPLVACAYSHFRGVFGRINKEFRSNFSLFFFVLKDVIPIRDERFLSHEIASVDFHWPGGNHNLP